ncbi:hypothetical protein CJP72_21940 [Citrobacter sp. NCU1]|uniref:hypothetical protein n=1 Tax=Citrobacter sp. NCU1 TaxID=2026683 RepID=UPI00139111AF|nr:hypothetical protein [Citrobacter sp. NCU1]NDO83321.1 hypothetical protein [Citrobacter sp. NCU1]
MDTLILTLGYYACDVTDFKASAFAGVFSFLENDMPRSLLRVDADDVREFSLSVSSGSTSGAIEKLRNALDVLESGNSHFAEGKGSVMLINNEVKAASRRIRESQ